MFHAQRSLNATGSIPGLFCGVILAAAVAGCAGTRGFPLWPQGPGDASAEVLRAAQTEPSQASTRIETDRSPSTPPANSHAQAVRSGDLLFVSGQIGDYPASQATGGSGIQVQMRAAMDNILHILESHGMTMSNVLSVTLYMQEIDELPKAEAAYASYFRRSLPARSVVRVNGLPNGSLVEISVIAGK